MVMDHYLNGIMSILFGNVTPVEAIESIESPEDSSDVLMGEGFEA